MSKNRVVITGLGIVSALGNTLDEFWNRLINGESGVDYISKFNAKQFECKVAGEVHDFKLENYGMPKRLAHKIDDFTKYALATTEMCIKDSKIVIEEQRQHDIGIFVGNCLGGVGFGEKELYHLYQNGSESVSPYQAISWFYAAPQGQISIYYKIKGYSKTYVADRISSDVALGAAYEAIQLNRAKHIFVCGTENQMHPYGYLGIMQSKMITSKSTLDAYRPYDLTRNGLVMGEGAGTLLLEEMETALERNAPIYAEIIGYASTCDGVHHAKSDETGDGLKRVISLCIQRAGIEKEDIDYVNLDGVASQKDDYIEQKVLKEFFKSSIDSIAFSAPKASYGHTFGAAGAMDMIVNCKAMQQGVVPPTINYKNKDDVCDLNCTYNKSVKKDINVVLQIARGRGGINSAILIKKYKNKRKCGENISE